MDDAQRAQVPELAPTSPGEWKPWTADDIRRERHHAKALEIHREFLARPALASLDQREQLKDLSARLGLPGMADAVTGITEAQAAAVIRQMEVAAKGLPKPIPEQVFTYEGLKSQTGLGPIENSDDAEAFLARLERSAAARQAANPTPQPVVEQASAPAHAPIMTGNKDPRTWASAGEAVTSRQQWTLKQAGFSAEEIATLQKGSASYVIGHTSISTDAARAAFERNAQAAPWVPSTPAPEELSKNHRPTNGPVATDIRYQQRPPTQRP
jgi:hypothetical protein